MKHLLPMITLAICLISSNKPNTITEITAYHAMKRSVLTKQAPFPPGGIKITVDTIAKTVHIPLTGKVDKENNLYYVDTNFFPQYNPETQSVDYTIIDIQQIPDAIQLTCCAVDDTVECIYGKDYFSVIWGHLRYIYAGGEEARLHAENLNNLKQKAVDSLTGN